MLKDLQFAWRNLRTKPVFLAVAVLSLALGIGANTAIFSVIESSLLRGLPYKDAGQLYQVNVSMPQWDIASVSAPELLDYQRQTKTLSELAAFTSQALTLTGRSETRRLQGMAVTTNFFNVLGATAERGRLLSPQIDRPNADMRAAVISDGTWRSIFASDPHIVGHDIALNGKSFRIVGVLSPKQDYPSGFQVWISPRVPMPEQRETGDPDKNLESYGEHYLTGLARLRPGVTWAQAMAEARVIFQSINAQHPMASHDALVLVPLQETMVGKLRPALWVLLVAVAPLLLIACANLAGLLLARAVSRTREFAVRLAMGASRLQIIRLSLAESLLLALGGGVLGILFAAAGVELIAHTSPYHLPAALAPHLDIPVLLFCLGIALLSALLSGVIPALHSSNINLNAGLKEGSKGTASHNTHRLRSILVGGEVALAVLLLIGAGLLIRSFSKLIAVDAGFNPNGAITARFSLPETHYRTAPQIVGFWQQLLPALSHIPGVQSAGMLSNLPLSGSKNESLIRVEGRHYSSDSDGMNVGEFTVSPDTFKAMQVPLLAGRAIRETDTAKSPFVAVISKRFADVAFPHEDPIGKRFNGAHIPGWITVVGVAGNVTYDGLDAALEFDAYYSYQQDPTTSSGLVLRGNPSVTDLRKVFHHLDPNVPLTNVRPLGDYLSQSLSTRKFLLALLTTFSGLAILLAAIGLYAVLAFSVQQRKQEIGIRLALGATGGNVLWLILRECLTIAILGTAGGLLGAAWTTSFLKSMLYGITATDLTAYVAAVLLILAVALVASLAPAVRAGRLDPLSALRYE